MKNERIETLARESKPAEVKEYVKPTVTKHMAASLLVGSSGCTSYSASDLCGIGPLYYY